MNLIVFTFGDPIFAPRLKDFFGLPQWAIGLCFGLPTITYIITGPFLLQRFTKHFEKRTVIHFGFLNMCVSVLVCGPSATLHFAEKLWVMIIGLGLIGVGAASSVIPIIPEMLEAVDGKFKNKAKVKDVSSGIFNMANGFG
jgi:MFS family permease